MHGRCTRMGGAAEKRKLQSALTSNGLDHGERQIQFLQNRSLFDMQFKVAQRIVLEFSLRKFSGIQPKVFDRLLHGNAMRIPRIQECLIQPANQRTAADEWGAEAYSFLLGKADHLDAEAKPPSLQLFQQSDGKNNAQNPIVSTGVGNRIKV